MLSTCEYRADSGLGHQCTRKARGQGGGRDRLRVLWLQRVGLRELLAALPNVVRGQGAGSEVREQGKLKLRRDGIGLSNAWKLESDTKPTSGPKLAPFGKLDMLRSRTPPRTSSAMSRGEA